MHQPIDESDSRSSDTAGSQQAGRGRKRPKLEKYFKAMIKAGASDLHIKPGSPPHVRTATKIKPTRSAPLSAEEIAEMAYELLSEEQRAFFAAHGSIDVAHELDGQDRFRINIFRQRGNVAIAARRVTRKIPDFRMLHLPKVIAEIAEARHGLVLVSGAASSGKSTTIAAMLEHINLTRPCHIVTIEDPIEYLYEDKKALISQREVGIDVESFESALKYLMRADPDVVLIGEMRDRETFAAALQVSETGHLVFGTIHAATAAQTIGRVLDLFDHASRDLIRQSLAFNLRAIVCQKLLPAITKGFDRIPAVEILLTNPSVRQLISEAREGELPEVIRSHEREGMRSFTKSLLELIEKDRVDPNVAYEAAPNAEELKMLMKGISASRSGLLGR